MLQEQSRLFQRALLFADLVLVALGWVIAYFLRFEVLRPPEWVPFARYAELLPWVLAISSLVFWTSGLYSPTRAQRLPLLVFTVAKAVGLGLIVVAASLSFYRTFSFSRLHIILFGLFTPIMMVLLRVILYAVRRRARLHGKYLRRVLIVGAGQAGRRLEHAFRQYPWMGFDVIGFLDDQKTNLPDVLGPIDRVGPLVSQYEADGRPIDYVYVALPLAASDRIPMIMEELSTKLAHVCLVPDLFQLDILNSRITDIDGLPVIHLIDEAPVELRRFAKRVIDIAFSGIVLIITSPLFFLIGIAVKLSSRGPIYYRQERMSLNGQRFHMLKFRSMPVDAESQTGPVWAKPGEQRATWIGGLLRRTSLDELPQFINVLKGDMSVVGPRPERPVFIEEFREHVPSYMLRHKVKGGITGWAQVNGWRGNTSIEKRIEFDLYYIRNWSLLLDFRIMALTVWRGFVDRNAY